MISGERMAARESPSRKCVQDGVQRAQRERETPRHDVMKLARVGERERGNTPLHIRGYCVRAPVPVTTARALQFSPSLANFRRIAAAVRRRKRARYIPRAPSPSPFIDTHTHTRTHAHI